MLLPGVLAVLTPLGVGLLIGGRCLGGLLMGAISSGFLLAVMMNNAGGAWDNSKKYVENDQPPLGDWKCRMGKTVLTTQAEMDKAERDGKTIYFHDRLNVHYTMDDKKNTAAAPYVTTDGTPYDPAKHSIENGGLRKAVVPDDYATGIPQAAFYYPKGEKCCQAPTCGDSGCVTKGSNWHAAVVVGDTVGDPFKDTSGPALNILIKLMSVLSLTCAKMFRDDWELWWVGLIVFIIEVVLCGVIYYYVWVAESEEEKANGVNKKPVFGQPAAQTPAAQTTVSASVAAAAKKVVVTTTAPAATTTTTITPPAAGVQIEMESSGPCGVPGKEEDCN